MTDDPKQGIPNEQTERVPAPQRFLPSAIVISSAIAIALLAHFIYRQKAPKPIPPMVKPSPTATIPIEALPTATPTLELGPLLAKPTVSVPSTPTPAPTKPDLDLTAYQRQLEAYTPSAFRRLRPLLVELRKKGKPSHNLDVMLAQVYAYLGGRERKKEWIQYAYEVAFRTTQRVPDDPDAQKGLLLSLLAAKKMTNALPIAREMLSLFPSEPIFALAAGRASGDLDSLEKAYRKHTRFFPIGEALTSAYLDRHRYRDGERVGRLLLQREPNDPILGEMVGTAMEGQKKWAEAVLLYEPLVASNPDEWKLRFSLGRAQRMIKQFEAAELQLDSILSRTDLTTSVPDRARIYLERGKLEFDQAQFAKSLPYLKRAYTLNRSNISTLLYLGGAHYRMKSYGEAANRYREALRQDPENLQTERYLGMSLLEGGKLAEAEKHLKAVILGGDEDASLYYHLSRIREAAGDRGGAIAYLESALGKDPSYKNAQIRLKKLTGRTP